VLPRALYEGIFGGLDDPDGVDLTGTSGARKATAPPRPAHAHAGGMEGIARAEASRAGLAALTVRAHHGGTPAVNRQT